MRKIVEEMKQKSAKQSALKEQTATKFIVQFYKNRLQKKLHESIKKASNIDDGNVSIGSQDRPRENLGASVIGTVPDNNSILISDLNNKQKYSARQLLDS